MKKRKKGFTMIELLAVVAIIGILVSVAVPSISFGVEYTQKNITNTVHKVLVNAIDGWIKDNYDSAQRPDNFNSRNSQGHPVYKYINSNEAFVNSNLKVREPGTDSEWIETDMPEKGKVYVTFNKGVLSTSFIETDILNEKYKKVYGMYDLDASKTFIVGYDSKKTTGYIVGYPINETAEYKPDNIAGYREIVEQSTP